MGFISRIFGKKQDNGTKTGGMEDYMTLVRVYLQAAIAENVGITNLAMLPDLRVFKTTLHVPTVNNKLGVGERQRCRKMLQEMYGMSDLFFKEIDASIKKRCRKIQDVQAYMLQFQDFSQCLMMLMGNLMKFKLRLPSFMKKAFYAMTEKTVTQLFNKNDYSDPSVMKSVLTVREYASRLGFSQPWITEYVYNVVMLAKKEPAPNDSEVKK